MSVTDLRAERARSNTREQLVAALRDAGLACPDVDRAILALAHLAPEACVDFLLANEPALRTEMPPGALAAALDRAVLDGVKRAPCDRSLFGAAVVRFGDLALPTTTAALFANAPDAPVALHEILERQLERSPNDPALLRAMLAVVRSRGDDGRADALLTRLGLAEETPGTAALVHRLRKELLLPPKPSDVRVGLLSSYTVDGLVPFLDLHCRAAGLVPDIYLGPFNSWTREVIDDASELWSFDPDIVFLAVSIDDLIPELAGPLHGPDLADAGETALQRILAVATAFSAKAPTKSLIVHGLHSAFGSGPLGVADGRSAPSRREWLASLNAQLMTALRAMPRCYLVDIEHAVAVYGGTLRDNPKMRHLAAMRLPPAVLGAVARAYVAYVAPQAARTRKCVVLDLDNTLWGGVVGEDGKDGIRLGDTAPGSEFVEFQSFLKGLAQRGILLAVNSKNNPEDALDVIRTHPAMVLREDAFSAIRINWKTKAENVASIAAELNIGLDSLVFVDDNPDEREQMRQLAPEVLTVELPRDPSLYRRELESLPQLEVLAVTNEDRDRTESYRTARLRDGAKVSAASLDEYLESLKIETEIAPPAPTSYGRIAQLFSRTNQFNLTTLRHDLADVECFAADPDALFLALRSRDRFGDHGLVAVALARIVGDTCEIDSFLMSCRVIGYGIETALLSALVRLARRRGVGLMRATFIETKKNAPAADFLARHGFHEIAADGVGRRWEMALEPSTVPFPKWIQST